MTQVSTKAWYAPLKRAGIEDFRWHDLHAHLGELARAERNATFTPCRRWAAGRSRAMVPYAHLPADHLVPFADRLAALRVVGSQSDGTPVATRAMSRATAADISITAPSRTTTESRFDHQRDEWRIEVVSIATMDAPICERRVAERSGERERPDRGRRGFDVPTALPWRKS